MTMEQAPDITKTYTNGEITRGRPCGCVETCGLYPLQSLLDAVDSGL